MACPAWESHIYLRLLPYLGDHCVQRAAILPAAAYVEMALAAALEMFSRSAPPEPVQIDDLQ
jgi:acyl transferase domain-containing protein